jgi:hypothetical protein
MPTELVLTPSSLLRALRAAGFTPRPDGERLIVTPKDRLTDEWRQALREHKAGLLSLLADEAAAETMLTPSQLLRDLRAAKLTVRADGDGLAVSPKERLTEEWRQAIREHKAGLLALLADEAEEAAAEEAGRPFQDVPYGGGPNEIPASEYQAFWTGLEEWNQSVIRRAEEEEARQQARAAAKSARRKKTEGGSAGAGMALTGLGEPCATA